jgi:plastocyanin
MRNGNRTALAILIAFSAAANGCGDRQGGAAVPPAEIPNEVTGRAAAAARGLPSAIILRSDAAAAAPVPSEPAVMDQFAIAFSPRLLVVRQGQPVEFRNSEEVPHNVKVRAIETDSVLFSESPEMGRPYVYRFDRTGEYRVTCDIHSGMTATVLVVSTPYAVVAEDDGSFAIPDVPPGPYTLTVWHTDPTLRSEKLVEITPGRTQLLLDSIR